jgi:hypothetical protein
MANDEEWQFSASAAEGSRAARAQALPAFFNTFSAAGSRGHHRSLTYGSMRRALLSGVSSILSASAVTSQKSE